MQRRTSAWAGTYLSVRLGRALGLERVWLVDSLISLRGWRVHLLWIEISAIRLQQRTDAEDLTARLESTCEDWARIALKRDLTGARTLLADQVLELIFGPARRPQSGSQHVVGPSSDTAARRS